MPAIWVFSGTLLSFLQISSLPYPRKMVAAVPSLRIKDRSQPQAPFKGRKVDESTALPPCPFCYLSIVPLISSRTLAGARGLCHHVPFGRSQTYLLLEPGRDVSPRAKRDVNRSPWRHMAHQGKEAAASWWLALWALGSGHCVFLSSKDRWHWNFCEIPPLLQANAWLLRKVLNHGRPKNRKVWASPVRPLCLSGSQGAGDQGSSGSHWFSVIQERVVVATQNEKMSMFLGCAYQGRCVLASWSLWGELMN